MVLNQCENAEGQSINTPLEIPVKMSPQEHLSLNESYPLGTSEFPVSNNAWAVANALEQPKLMISR